MCERERACMPLPSRVCQEASRKTPNTKIYCVHSLEHWSMLETDICSGIPRVTGFPLDFRRMGVNFTINHVIGSSGSRQEALLTSGPCSKNGSAPVICFSVSASYWLIPVLYQSRD